jgi:hypothetical protein
MMGDDDDTSSESLAGINGLTFRVYRSFLIETMGYLM